MWGAYYCKGAYKCNMVTAIKMSAYIHKVLFFMVAYYRDFTVFCLIP